MRCTLQVLYKECYSGAVAKNKKPEMDGFVIPSKWEGTPEQPESMKT